MQVNEKDGVQIIELTVRIDVISSPELEKLCNSLLDGGHFQLICDFCRTEYVSSAGLRVFLSTLKRIRKAGGELVLCCLKPGILEIFDMTGFTGLFTIVDSSEAALAVFHSKVLPDHEGKDERQRSEIEAIRIAKQAKEATLAYETAQKLGQMNEKDS